MSMCEKFKSFFDRWFDKKAEAHEEVKQRGRRLANPDLLDIHVKPTKNYVGPRERRAVRAMHRRNAIANAKENKEKAANSAHFYSFQKHDVLVRRLGSRLARRLAPYINYSYSNRTGVEPLDFEVAKNFTIADAEQYLKDNAVGLRRAS